MRLKRAKKTKEERTHRFRERMIFIQICKEERTIQRERERERERVRERVKEEELDIEECNPLTQLNRKNRKSEL